MNIRIKTFASLKDILGFSDKKFEFEENISAGSVIAKLREEIPGFSSYQGLILLAINEEFCSDSAKLKDGDVFAIFPPVSGG